MYFFILTPPQKMKKLISGVVLSSMLSLLFTIPVNAADVVCGEWNDVPEEYVRVVTDICEFGLIQGNSETTYLTGSVWRSHIAVISSRIAIENYDDIDEGIQVYKDYSDNVYTDAPPTDSWNEWILKGMKYAYEVGVMTGDAGEETAGKTTFRATDNVNMAEAFKVLIEAAREGEILGGLLIDYRPPYVGEKWYNGFMDLLDREGVISDYNGDLDVPTFTLLGGPNGDEEFAVTDWPSRLDLAVMLDRMIEKGIIQEDKL